ncbi:murein biosynthesis integral membrane protein MurJ [Chlamydiales bacterium]|nr:murein biosynthesis integral membrane protein MurJ [Chlamydiales bacterium]
MKDSLSSIYRSAAHFLTGTAISRLTGLLRDISIAYAFGTTPEVAGFLVAFRLSHLARRLLGEGALQQAFIPLFEDIRKEDEKRALSFFRTLSRGLSLLLVLLILVCSTGLFFLEKWVDIENQEITWLTLLMLPSLLFICLFGLNSSLLQCERRYFAPAIAPVAFNIVWVFGALAFHSFPQNEAMRWMALTINLACLGQWMMTIPFLNQELKNAPPLPSLFPPELKKLIRMMGLGVLGVAAVQVNNAVDPLFARFADLSGPAWLWFAIRIEQFPLGVFALALSTALLPPLSRAIQRNDQQEFRYFLSHALQKSGGLMIPLSFAMIAVSTPLVSIVYGYGEFDTSSILYTSYCLMAYTLGLAPSTFVLIQASAFYAQKNYKTPAIGSILTMSSNFLLNSVMIFFLGWSAISVAISTSISAFLNALFLGMRQDTLHIIPSFMKTTFASICAFLFTVLIPINTTHPTLELSLKTFLFYTCLSATGWAIGANDLLFWKTNTKEPITT